MNPFEKLLNVIAPEYCIECGQENYLFCPSCYNSISKLGSICYQCQKATHDNLPCSRHLSKYSPEKVFCLNKYDGSIKEYITQYKFETKRSAGYEIAKYMSDDLPMFEDEYLVTWVPTTQKRIRQNGYDHSCLIAKNFAKIRKLKYRKLINRDIEQPLHNLSKKDRFKSIENYYHIEPAVTNLNTKIILIDDIATTGATIKYISKILKKHGAKEIIACVFAKTY